MAKKNTNKKPVNVVKQTSDKPKNDSDEKLLKDLTDKVDNWYRYSAEHITRARNVLQFLYVDQWETQIRQARESLSKPTLQFNKLVSLVRSIIGDQRKNSPALDVRPIGGKKIDQKEIDVRNGLLRQIAYESNADIIFQTAGRQGLECGWGAARVIIDYEDANSFNKCLYVEPIVDFQSAFWDPVSQEQDRSDGDYCGVYTVISKERFEKIYPDIETPQSAPSEASNYYFRWNTRDTITMCEIYVKEYYKKKIVQLSDGNELDEDKAKEVLDAQAQFLSTADEFDLYGFTPLEIVNEREVTDCYKIKHYKFIQNHILERTDYPGQILPIVYFEGDSVVVDGERIPLPFVQDAIDPQKLINFLGSEIAYAVLRSRKENVMGIAENFAGREALWRNPDQVQGPLIFNPGPKEEKPEFISPPVFNPVLLQLYQGASVDIQQTTGFYEEARGQESNAQSGIAIAKRQQASSRPVNVYTDNWARGIKQIGKICLDLMPHIYDTERSVTIMTEDGKSVPATLNKVAGKVFSPDGDYQEVIENDMAKGKYDIEVRVDGSYDEQQAAAMDVLLRLATAFPPIAQLIPDLLAENSGLENTQQLVERLKTLLPPEIRAKEDGKPLPPQQPPPPNPELIIADMKNKTAMAELQLKKAQLAVEEQKLMQEAQIAGLEHQATLTKAQAEIQKAMASKEIAAINHATAVRKSHADLLKSHQGANNV